MGRASAKASEKKGKEVVMSSQGKGLDGNFCHEDPWAGRKSITFEKFGFLGKGGGGGLSGRETPGYSLIKKGTLEVLGRWEIRKGPKRTKTWSRTSYALMVKGERESLGKGETNRAISFSTMSKSTGGGDSNAQKKKGKEKSKICEKKEIRVKKAERVPVGGEGLK